MSLVDVDTWVTEYEACERLNHQLLQQLTQREKRQRLSPEYNRLTAGIHVGLQQFDVELKQLKSKLSAATQDQTITFEETEQRQTQVNKLQSQFQHLQSKFSNSTPTDRVALLDDASSSVWQQQQSANAVPIPPTDVTTLKQRQIDILEDQNKGLEVLSKTISRQRAIATQLGHEVEEQNEILDDLVDTMEHVDARVNVETGNIAQVNRKDSTWYYWIVILVLFIAIVVVAVI